MIIQKSEKYKYDKPAIERVKGYTKIELKDIHTKHRKVIESENTFQADILAEKMLGGAFRYGAYDDAPRANSKTYFYSTISMAELAMAQMKNTVGGIMLFRDEIKVGSRYMPAGNIMVGNGGYGVTNSGTPTELGSFNDSLSDVTRANTLKFVYDWGTAQGNGTIGSVCLTSMYGGLIGMGNPSGGVKESRYNPCAYQTRTPRISSGNTVKYRDFIYDFSTAIDYTNKTITVKKYTLNGIEKASIFDGRSRDLTYTWTGNINYHQNYQVMKPVTDGKGKILIPIPNRAGAWDAYLPDNTTGYYIELDCTTDTFTMKSVANHTGMAIWWGGNDAGGLGYDSDNNIFMTVERGTQSDSHYKRMLLMSLADGTLVKTVYGSAEGTSPKMGFRLAEGLWYCGQQGGAAYIYDAVNDTVYPTNGSIDVGENSFFNPTSMQKPYIDEETGLVFSQTSGGINCYYNPCFLATINNLDQAETKQPTQTMEITYILTEV